jgi:tRNA-dihydrouridine synthase A
MRQASDIPVSVKSRIGVDDMESYEQLSNFVTQIENAGCENFVIHAK